MEVVHPLAVRLSEGTLKPEPKLIIHTPKASRRRGLHEMVFGYHGFHSHNDRSYIRSLYNTEN